ncbi:MAG: nucleoside triphosphate pyrophosphohydrolase, partial [Cytophagales bacterium]|nr:nucleoside triphosphate pyrophosphohydrolase [Armatimonadota bacterium]
MLTIIGLGPGNPLSLPPRAFSLLTDTQTARTILVRTVRHPVFEAEPLAARLRDGAYIALDDEYESNQSFDDVYAAIVARVLRVAAGAGAEGEVVYAVPGHPLVGESTVARLLPQAKAQGIPTRIVGAPSFVEASLELLAEAVTGDLHVLDALLLDPKAPSPPAALRTGGPMLLYQVHSRDVASDTKLALMRAGYPDNFPVVLIQAAGIPGREKRITLPLYELDRRQDHDHLTSVWVPDLPTSERRPSFAELVAVMARLRHPENGCPWDLKQSHESLKPYVIEEAHEVVDAIDSGDPEKLSEELGDLLLQVVFHAQLASEEGVFDSEDVCTGIVEKLVRRHPHIFGETTVTGADEVLANWQAIKATEKGNADRLSLLDGIPQSLPALLAALETSKRVVKVGFEWPDIGGVLDKAVEEFAELRAEIERDDAPRERIAAELG